MLIDFEVVLSCFWLCCGISWVCLGCSKHQKETRLNDYLQRVWANIKDKSKADNVYDALKEWVKITSLLTSLKTRVFLRSNSSGRAND